MQTLPELKLKMDDFWSLEDAEQNELLAAIRKYADACGSDEFIKEVRSSFEQHSLSSITVIYHALSVEPEKWRTFFKGEYERAFKSAEHAENAVEILDCLEEIGFSYKYLESDFDEIISLLSKYLSSDNPVLRHKAVWYLGSWIDEKNAGRYRRVIALLEERLKDKNWKIRFITKDTLEDIKQVRGEYSRSGWDTLRARFGNPYKI